VKTADYDVQGYESQEEFDAGRFWFVETNISRKRDALAVAKDALATFPIVKVQSGDRTFITVLTRGEQL
jgi:hypothetical protein